MINCEVCPVKLVQTYQDMDKLTVGAENVKFKLGIMLLKRTLIKNGFGDVTYDDCKGEILGPVCIYSRLTSQPQSG